MSDKRKTEQLNEKFKAKILAEPEIKLLFFKMLVTLAQNILKI